MTTELKPCPFCGSEAELSVDDCQPVVCTNEACIASGSTFLLYTDKKAISLWNRRAPGWISVKERKPENYEHVLLVYADSDGDTFMKVTWYLNDEFLLYDHVQGNTPIFWMPAPEWPKEGKA